MAANFVVVDGEGTIVDLAALVSGAAEQIAVEDLSDDADLFEDVPRFEGLTVRARGMRVCMGFQFPDNSRSGRELEIETEGVGE